jgi:hypothetical protein
MNHTFTIFSFPLTYKLIALIIRMKDPSIYTVHICSMDVIFIFHRSFHSWDMAVGCPLWYIKYTYIFLLQPIIYDIYTHMS